MTNQERGRENSNSNFGQTLDQLIVKLSLDKSNPTSDISSMWPRDHFSFEIGKSEGVRKALIYELRFQILEFNQQIKTQTEFN